MFSQTCKNAIRSVLFLTLKTSPDSKMSIVSIANELKLPTHFLGKILQRLAKEKIISSTKGPNGGFFMSEANKKGVLKSVILCIDGNGFYTDCSLGLDSCNAESPCVFHNSFAKLKIDIVEITNKTFEEMSTLMLDSDHRLLRL